MELIDLLEKGISTRKSTITKLRKIAHKLDQVQSDVNISKITGTSASVGGTLLAGVGLVANVFSFGLVTPLLAGGLGLAALGGVTTAGADIAGTIISNSETDDGTKEIKEDQKNTEKINKKEEEFRKKVEEICKVQCLNEDQAYLILFMGSLHENINFGNIFSICTKLGIIFKVLTRAKKVADATIRISEAASKAIGGITMKALSGVSKGVLSAAMLGFDIYTMVTTSIDIHNGSKSEAAKEFRKYANFLEEKLQNTEEFVENIRWV